MDPVSAALIGYGLNRTLEGLFAIGGQRRALRNALGRSLARFRDLYVSVAKRINFSQFTPKFQKCENQKWHQAKFFHCHNKLVYRFFKALKLIEK